MLKTSSFRVPVCAMALLAALTWGEAATEQTVTIDGTTIDNTITQIVFSGDEATLTFADGTTQTIDMALLTITFAYDGTTTGIRSVDTGSDNSTAGIVYTIDGRRAGNTLKGLGRGTYIVGGKKIIIR